MPDDNIFDFAVVGGGVVGSAIAFYLSQREAQTVLIESANDVGTGTSKANTAILHTGFDASPGSLETKLVARGYALMRKFAPKTGIPVEYTGALLIAWNEEQLAQFPAIEERARKNGVQAVKHISRDEVYARESHLGPGALAGLEIAEEAIICPFTPVIAYATHAQLNGTKLLFNAPLTSVTKAADHYLLQCGKAEIKSRWIINAAGLHSDEIDRLFGHGRFHITPRRGELIVFDKLARPLLSQILLPVPTKITKGVLVSPTVFGNVLLGPTAEDLHDKQATETSASGLAGLLEKGRKILPALIDEEVTSIYAGLRAATEHSDYQIHIDRAERYICAGGIRSTGLSASLAIAEYITESLAEALPLSMKSNYQWTVVPPIGENSPRRCESEELIARNADYGRIVCHCERVSRGEILDAMNSPVPARDLDGLRRRTRCLQGRCQGFYCLANVNALLNHPPSEVESA